MCKGCGNKYYQRAEKIPQQYGIQEKRHNGIPLPGQIHFQNGNIHFHLRKECLRHHDDTVQLCEIMMHEEVFEDLSIEQMSVLNQKGFLKYITANFGVFK